MCDVLENDSLTLISNVNNVFDAFESDLEYACANGGFLALDCII